MTLPAVSPLVLLFRTVQRQRRAGGNLAVPTATLLLANAVTILREATNRPCDVRAWFDSSASYELDEGMDVARPRALIEASLASVLLALHRLDDPALVDST